MNLDYFDKSLKDKSILVLGVSNQSKEDLRERYNLPDEAQITGLDIVERKATDKVHNLTEYPWPFDNNSFDLVIASHVVEHLPEKVKPHKEIHRILKPEGISLIKVPHFSVNNAHNLEHEHYYNHVTFNPFETPEWYGKGYPHFTILETKLNWKKKTENGIFPTKISDRAITLLANKSNRVAERYWHGYVGGFDEIVFKMKCEK